jgi:methylenetetrahydrofolate--tRNA-(uracil-5-)-methyltransferase
MELEVSIVGAGLAGSEAALQLAHRGIRVRLYEQKPQHKTPAQSSDKFCELVCSNSMRAAGLTNAVGLLKEEMRHMGSFVIGAADHCKVPAGGALAVDRERFSDVITEALRQHPNIEVIGERVDKVPSSRPTIIATGPLTADALASDIAQLVGTTELAYYDAIAPIVSADSINWEVVYKASRYDKGDTEEERKAYANCPMDEEQYRTFVAALQQAQKVEPKSFEDVRYFEGCLPIEVMAARGEKTLAFGPMKPVGLRDPRTGRMPAAVVQLRKEDEAGTAYNLVGFQTRMTWPEQARVLRTIPGLENAEFVRYGAVHRNTFLNAPTLLDDTFQLIKSPGLYFAGQISGTEGYVESAAGGMLVAHFVAARLRGREATLPPLTTALRGLIVHTRRDNGDYQPSNITFSHIAPWSGARLHKRAKYAAMSERALTDLDLWLRAEGVTPRLLNQASDDAVGEQPMCVGNP